MACTSLASAGKRSACDFASQQRYLPESGTDTAGSPDHNDDTDEGEWNMTQIDYPLHFDSQGHTAKAPDEKHIRDLIEQVLFTAPGERVNRPAFGSGLMQLVFAPNSDNLASATQFLVQGALQQLLSDLIQVEAVTVDNQESTLQITVQYTIRRSQQRQIALFSRGGL